MIRGFIADVRQFAYEWRRFGFRVAFGNLLAHTGKELLGGVHMHICYPDNPCDEHRAVVGS